MSFYVCDLKTDSFEEIYNIWRHWRKNKRVNDVMKNPDEAFGGMVETFFRVEIGALKFIPVSKGDIKLFTRSLEKYLLKSFSSF